MTTVVDDFLIIFPGRKSFFFPAEAKWGKNEFKLLLEEVRQVQKQFFPLKNGSGGLIKFTGKHGSSSSSGGSSSGSSSFSSTGNK